MRSLAVFVVVACSVGVGHAQAVSGYGAVMVDGFPAIDVVELRTRVFAEYRRELGPRVRLVAAGFAEGLLAERGEPELTRAGIIRPQELSLESAWAHADVRVGFTRIAWGRLDELLPTDVVNPQDLTKFFFEGRTEGRMPVAMIRARWLPSDNFALESIYVPIFRPGRFDELDEPTSPFSIRLPYPVERREPAHTFGNAQGGLRATATTARVDWSVSAYRGFESLPVYEGATAQFPRFTMVGGDFETVRGEWGLRGEVAVFVERTLQVADAPVAVDGKSVEAGIGVDRKAGAYRVSGNIVVANRIVNAAGIDRRDLTVVAVVDRSFARETRALRMFAAYNPGEQSAFVRAIASMSLRDDVALEGSAGAFAGSGEDVFARFTNRDFVYVRLKAFF